MSLDYLNEAFKKLELINEASFDTSTEGINKLSDFMEESDVIDDARVIDPEADDETQLEDSYVGKVITNCNICHSHIFKEKSDIVISDDGIVNPDDQCPYCGESEGFTVVGEIVEFTEDGSNEADATKTEEPTSTTECLTEDVEIDTKFDNSAILRELMSTFINNNYSIDSLDCLNYLDAATEYIITARKNDPDYTVSQWFKDTVTSYPDDLAPFKITTNESVTTDTEQVDEDAKNEIINESVEDIKIQTESDSITVTPSESGSITVSVEATETETEPEEVIAPVSDKTIAEITDNEETIDVSEEEKSSEEVDIDIDELDDARFNELGESYLKTVYENISKFETNSVSTTGDSIIVEGFITFNSGVKKNTGFIFSPKDTTADGKVRFTGLNEHFSNDSEAFTLVGIVEGKKFIPQSLKYNYSLNESNQHVRGCVRGKRG